jgi:hypothetical protein
MMEAHKIAFRTQNIEPLARNLRLQTLLGHGEDKRNPCPLKAKGKVVPVLY